MNTVKQSIIKKLFIYLKDNYLLKLLTELQYCYIKCIT